jgi:pyridinium-3,5-bisthiocarboxylic acid mononucleotide nickel chelatase
MSDEPKKPKKREDKPTRERPKAPVREDRPPRPESSGDRRPGGGGPPRSGGFGGPPPNRGGGFGGPPRDGGGPPRGGGFGGPPRDGGGPPPNRGGGFGGPPPNRGGGFGGSSRDAGPPRSGGFGAGAPREGFRPRREGPPRDGGFGPSRDDRGPSRDGGFGAPNDRRPSYDRDGKSIGAGASQTSYDRDGKPIPSGSAPSRGREAGVGARGPDAHETSSSEAGGHARPKIRRIVAAPARAEDGPPTERKNKFDRLAEVPVDVSDEEPLTPSWVPSSSQEADVPTLEREDEDDDLSEASEHAHEAETTDESKEADAADASDESNESGAAHAEASHSARQLPVPESDPRMTPPPPSIPTNVAALVEATLEDAALRVPELRAVLPQPPLSSAMPMAPISEARVTERTSVPSERAERAPIAEPLAPHAHTHDGGPAHTHDHEHEKGHGHAHGPGHGHAHLSDRKLHRADLALGSGRGKVLFLDAPAGLAGDMIVGALVDLGVPEAVVLDAIAKLGMGGFHVHFGGREQSGIVATTFDVHVDAPQPERTFKSVRSLILDSGLPQKVKDRALLVFEKLGRAEAKVHKMPIDDVHFHEVGAIDALCDVVGAAAALEYLGAEIVVSPLPMGRGFVKARHGILPLPAPATVECLAGFPTYDAGIDRELVTPTGAAIVGANAARSSRWPDLRVERVGWGAGTQTLPDRPNLLRVVLGPVTEEAQIAPSVGTHAILEANLDDATGELVAHCIDTLLREGALDAWATPNTTKKGRPGMILGCLVQVALAERLTAALLRESTTIGVRRTEVSRVTRPRRETVVQTPYGPISVKVSEGPFGTPQQKPEFDECVRAAAFHRVPVREVLAAALEAARIAPHM